MQALQAYLSKQHPIARTQIEALPDPNSALHLTVVIPCFNEPDLVQTLQSLCDCDRPDGTVEVLVVLNHQSPSSEQEVAQNNRSLRDIKSWSTASPWLTILALDVGELKGKHAGVGLARKIGLDCAVERYLSLNKQGILVNLDADCLVAPDYFCQIEYMLSKGQYPAGHCQFDHLRDANVSAEQQAGAMRYELYLRYYKHALQFAGSAYAMFTIGSCIAVTTDAYVKAGGMNKRQAGEDFYFLQKVRALGEVVMIPTTVYPSARFSNRVPFGTGRAIEAWVSSGQSEYETYPMQTFEDLRQLFSTVQWLYKQPEKLPVLSEVLIGFLAQQKWQQQVQRIRDNSRHFSSFNKHFQHWFNGFMCMKFIHFAQSECYPRMALLDAAAVLLTKLGQDSVKQDYQWLVQAYRDLDYQQ